MYKVPVFNNQYRDRLVSRVQYNQILDNWNGSNWQRGGTGCHLGLTMLRDGTPVLIYGTQWQGATSYGVTVSLEEAANAVLETQNADEILENPRFSKIKEFVENNFKKEY